MNWLLEQADRFWPDWFIINWARGVMAISSIIVLIAIIEAVRHYVLGRPLTHADTNEAFSSRQALSWFLSFGGAGAFFLVIGALTYRWKSG